MSPLGHHHAVRRFRPLGGWLLGLALVAALVLSLPGATLVSTSTIKEGPLSQNLRPQASPPAGAATSLTTSGPAYQIGRSRARLGGIQPGWTEYADNWCGYAATGGSWTSVTATWVQPAVQTNYSSVYSWAAFWAGLDGDGSNTVEQTGTDAYSANGSVGYLAWYEMYPANPVVIPLTIRAADEMTATVTTDGSGNYTLTLTDDTTGDSYTTMQAGPTQPSSAEVIAEDPGPLGSPVPLADFDTVDFSGCAFNGQPLSAFACTQWDMESNSGVLEAVPSALGGDGASFSVSTVATPANITPPVVSGTAQVGDSLSCSTGSWTGKPTPILTYQWLRDGSPISGATVDSYQVQAVDQGHGLACQVTASNVAGQTNETSNAAQIVDTTAPTTTVSGADDLWHTTPVTLTLTATDNVDGSGMSGGQATTQYKIGPGEWTTGTTVVVPAPADHSGDGAQAVSYRSCDAAGNWETAKTVTVKIDTTVPTISVLGCDAAWHANPVTLSFMPTVGASGLASVQYQVGSGGWTTITPSGDLYSAAISTEGANTVSYRATNNAGVTSAVGACSVKIDTTPPTVSASGAKDGAWLNHAVTITLSATDPGGSGVASISYNLDGVALVVNKASTQVVLSVSPNHLLTYQATDEVGNVSAEQSLSVHIDTIGPTTLARAAKGRKGRAIALKCLVRDNLSPQAKAVALTIRNSHGKFVKRFVLGTEPISTWCTVKWTPKAKGTYRYTITAKDLAGNRQTKAGSATVTVN